MDITVFNPTDGTTITIAPGDEGVVTIPQTVGAQGKRVLILTGVDALTADLADWTPLTTVAWLHWGDLVADALQMDAAYTSAGMGGLAPACAIAYSLANVPVGTYWQAVRLRVPVAAIGDGSTEVFTPFDFRIKIQIVPVGTFVGRRTALPDKAIDLEFDLALGVVRSANLGLRGPLAVGSAPTFAVVPSLAGSVLLSLVTHVSLCLRRKNEFAEPKLIEFSADGTITGSGDGQHYALTDDLASDAITAALEDLDDEAVDVNNPDRVQVLECLAQLRVIYDGKNYVSAPFAVSLFQPVDETLL